MACEYLYATIQNFSLLKDELAQAGLIETYESAGFNFNPFNLIDSPFTELDSYLSLRSGTEIDFLVDVFSAWHGYVEKRVGESFPKLKHDFYDVSSMPRMGLKSKFNFYMRCNEVIVNAGLYVSGPILKQKLGLGSALKSEEATNEILPYVRQQARQATKGIVTGILSKPRRFREAYYVISEGFIPERDPELVINGEGLDFLSREL